MPKFYNSTGKQTENLETRRMTISSLQSVGCRKGIPEAARFIASCVQEASASGQVAAWIAQYGVEGKLTPAT